jgi:hypothetical protein
VRGTARAKVALVETCTLYTTAGVPVAEGVQVRIGVKLATVELLAGEVRTGAPGGFVQVLAVTTLEYSEFRVVPLLALIIGRKD